MLFVNPSHNENFSPFSGFFKAIDRLLVGRFLHMPAEGEWTLGVLDNAVDGSNGTVVSWSLELETRPCDWRSALRSVYYETYSTPATLLFELASMVVALRSLGLHVPESDLKPLRRAGGNTWFGQRTSDISWLAAFSL